MPEVSTQNAKKRPANPHRDLGRATAYGWW
jgi:hypothetical protein